MQKVKMKRMQTEERRLGWATSCRQHGRPELREKRALTNEGGSHQQLRLAALAGAVAPDAADAAKLHNTLIQQPARSRRVTADGRSSAARPRQHLATAAADPCNCTGSTHSPGGRDGRHNLGKRGQAAPPEDRRPLVPQHLRRAVGGGCVAPGEAGPALHLHAPHHLPICTGARAGGRGSEGW